MRNPFDSFQKRFGETVSQFAPNVTIAEKF